MMLLWWTAGFVLFSAAGLLLGWRGMTRVKMGKHYFQGWNDARAEKSFGHSLKP